MLPNQTRWRPGRHTQFATLFISLVVGVFPFLGIAEGEKLRPGAVALQQLLSATGKLAGKDSSGTCFLLRPPASAGWPNNVFILVTAAHALSEVPGAEAHLVLRDRRPDGSYLRREIPLLLRSGDRTLWRKHPQEDVAVLRFSLPRDVTCDPPNLGQLAQSADFVNGSIALGTDTWIFGCPAQLEVNEAGFPVLRHGSIASLPLIPIDSHRTFLVDFSTFGGDSGGPVMHRDSGMILGLVLGMHRQTDRTVIPFEERTVHHPLGLAIVAHAGVIRETVELLLH